MARGASVNLLPALSFSQIARCMRRKGCTHCKVEREDRNSQRDQDVNGLLCVPPAARVAVAVEHAGQLALLALGAQRHEVGALELLAPLVGLQVGKVCMRGVHGFHAGPAARQWPYQSHVLPDPLVSGEGKAAFGASNQVLHGVLVPASTGARGEGQH